LKRRSLLCPRSSFHSLPWHFSFNLVDFPPPLPVA
jgi:hypothetical protein